MTNTMISGFDPVHDSQHIFREMVDAFSRPGTQTDVQKFCESTQPPAAFPKAMMGIAFTLLDQETTFQIESGQAEAIRRYIHWETFSKAASGERADYHFVESMEQEQILPFMKQLKTGTLYQPHQSATVFLLVDGFERSESAKTYDLTGPGIESKKSIYIEGINHKWMEHRDELTVEYPLGIDICLITRTGKLIAIPRTTKVERR
ncbi:phosphonate C-P lyase system protein PhnH [Halobacillus halophilus]|uniref:phosphonate C-P lyase system protein PhnH n=1 Tax=Halobacillus halophilus TaxID=1570 RepID=UPI001CD58E32|nr:phosphonate C-P lyase system protein PhnH [Halobacillus halophilus]MCA1011962.1 phosphonate C-P lyase system protein PhnH [Halobacillus halophilus]